MEKRTPNCSLAVVTSLVIAGRIRVTSSALAGAAYLKLTVFEDVLVVSFKEL